MMVRTPMNSSYIELSGRSGASSPLADAGTVCALAVAVTLASS
jgi:hypothetical protein